MCVDRLPDLEASTPPAVLVVAADPLVQRLVGYLMHRWGVAGEVVATAQEAVAKCATRRYHLVLMDAALPEAAAPEAALGECRDGCLGPIVLLTDDASGEPSPGGASPADRPSERFAKPITAERLRELFVRHAVLTEDALMTPPPNDDPSPLRSVLADDEDMRDLIVEFASALPARLADIRAAIEADDFPRVTKLAHQLKGAGGMYGYPDLSQVAALLEQAAKEGHQEELLRELIAEADALIARIERGLSAD